MKVLHLTFGYPPDPPGGTELYVDGLCRALRDLRIDSVVAAPATREGSYTYHDQPVRRFAIRQHGLSVDELYGDGDPAAAAALDDILDDERPDLVHQHALTAACSVLVARRIKARGLPLVFTYHTPTATCQRGTLIERGQRQCDGRVDPDRCASCTLDGLGVGRSMTWLLSRMPPGTGDVVGRAGLQGGVWTAMRMRSLTRQHQRALHEFFELTDRVVALTPWVRDVLTGNGVRGDRIIDCPHGIAGGAVRRPAAMRNDGIVRIAHLGRLDPTKGTELLVKALRALPDAPIHLDVFGVIQSDTDAAVRQRLGAAAGFDRRIRLLAPVPNADVIDRLSEYDLVAVPSQWLETGPLVVLEAFAAGVPVLGSNLGGIAARVRDGIDGRLVTPFNDVAAWTRALSAFGEDRGLAARLACGIRPVRRMSEVAREMAALYATLCGVSQSRTADAIVDRLAPLCAGSEAEA